MKKHKIILEICRRLDIDFGNELKDWTIFEDEKGLSCQLWDYSNLTFIERLTPREIAIYENLS